MSTLGGGGPWQDPHGLMDQPAHDPPTPVLEPTILSPTTASRLSWQRATASSTTAGALIEKWVAPSHRRQGVFGKGMAGLRRAQTTADGTGREATYDGRLMVPASVLRPSLSPMVRSQARSRPVCDLPPGTPGPPPGLRLASTDPYETRLGWRAASALDIQ